MYRRRRSLLWFQIQRENDQIYSHPNLNLFVSLSTLQIQSGGIFGGSVEVAVDGVNCGIRVSFFILLSGPEDKSKRTGNRVCTYFFTAVNRNFEDFVAVDPPRRVPLLPSP